MRETNEKGQAAHTRTLVRRVIGAGEQLSDDLHRDVLRLGEAAVPALLEILEGEARGGAGGDFSARVLAARLLGELGAAAAGAVDGMLRVLAATDALDFLHDQLVQSLREIGAPVVEPALRGYRESVHPECRDSICAVLAEVGVHDDRIFAVLIEQLRRDPSRAGNLAVYGDERAIPHLAGALDDYEVVASENPLANHALVELRAAIEELGGTLTAEQQLKCRRGRESSEVFRRKIDALLASYQRDVIPVEPARRRARPGRNDPCWCGSARKYKKCHLAADESSSPGTRRGS